jgi:ubiquinol-cytochrome c reductase cytochrome b subunit
VDKPTLIRFFSFHFILPFVILFVVVLHLVFLHETGSSNPSGISSNSDKIPFHPFFSSKDTVGFLIIFLALLFISTLIPNYFTDPENFSKANPLVTPIHIQPEWYFLFAYTILRRVPNKLGGVIALILAIAILYIFPLINTGLWQGTQFSPERKILF